MKTLPVILGILLSLIPTTSHAQSTFGVVLGTVKDASGAVVGNAAVRLTNLGENIQRETLTDVNGDYEFLNAKPGNYSVSINRSGFRTFSMRDLTLVARQTLRVDAALQVGDVAESGGASVRRRDCHRFPGHRRIAQLAQGGKPARQCPRRR